MNKVNIEKLFKLLFYVSLVFFITGCAIWQSSSGHKLFDETKFIQETATINPHSNGLEFIGKIVCIESRYIDKKIKTAGIEITLKQEVCSKYNEDRHSKKLYIVIDNSHAIDGGFVYTLSLLGPLSDIKYLISDINSAFSGDLNLSIFLIILGLSLLIISSPGAFAYDRTYGVLMIWLHTP